MQPRTNQTVPTPSKNLRCLWTCMRILVAEDDAPLADFICEELQREQFAVQKVADGVEAQGLASNQNYRSPISSSNASPTRSNAAVMKSRSAPRNMRCLNYSCATPGSPS